MNRICNSIGWRCYAQRHEVSLLAPPPKKNLVSSCVIVVLAYRRRWRREMLVCRRQWKLDAYLWYEDTYIVVYSSTTI
jgi:hypothetical protein